MSITISSLSQMTDTARVWVYQSGNALSEDQAAQLTELGRAFVEQWASHGSKLAASFEVLHNRFAILAVDESQAGASGCSIDTSVHFMQEMEQRFDTSFFDRMILCYREGERIKDCKMTEIPVLVKDAHLTKATIIFDNTIQSKADLDSRWEVKMGDSWAGRYF